MPARYLFVALLAAALCPMPVKAQQLVECYRAFLSEADHFNSNGQRLSSAAAIIRQDRANFHRFGVRDPGDESDSFFADEGNRAALERLIARGRSTRGAISRIVNSTVSIRTCVYIGPEGQFVDVTVLN